MTGRACMATFTPILVNELWGLGRTVTGRRRRSERECGYRSVLGRVLRHGYSLICHAGVAELVDATDLSD